MALAATVTAPPAAPLLDEDDGDGDGVAEAEADDGVGERAAGTTVESVPSSTSTFCAGSDASGLAVPPKSAAILAALADALAP